MMCSPRLLLLIQGESPCFHPPPTKKELIKGIANCQLLVAVFFLFPGRCTVHLLLIQAISEVFFEHYAALSIQNIELLLDAILSGHRFAYTANNDMRLRTGLGPTGNALVQSKTDSYL